MQKYFNIYNFFSTLFIWKRETEHEQEEQKEKERAS